MNVVFRNEAFMDLLGAFAGIFSAEAAQKKLSLLGKDKLGQIVAAPCVTITDDPFIAEGLNSSPFDDEGVPCTKKDVISAGVLSSMLYNLKSAAADGVKSTGNASKHGYASPIDTGFSNLIVHCGELDFDGLLTKAQSGIIVEDLAGLHSGTDSVTGDFSLSAKGYLFENGKIVRPVGCITVSGNFYTLLKNISELGTDSRWSLSGFCSPSVLVSTLDVGGM
jgi:PmbA protein